MSTPTKSTTYAVARRPSRWDEPFCEETTDEVVDQLLQREPFASMDSTRFPKLLSLRGILKNDARIVRCAPGDVVIREGDYGNSAFMILSGHALVCLDSLKDRLPEVGTPLTKLTLVERLMNLLSSSAVPEYRSTKAADKAQQWLHHSGEQGTRLFIQDVPRLLDETRTITLESGEIFGELAALSRSPRTASVVALDELALIEIRWQGLRDLIRFDDALKRHVELLYRQNSLNVHLRETPFLNQLPGAALQAVADATLFESYGDFDWHHDYRAQRDRDVARRVEAEPCIAKEGDHPNGMILIRSGFVRLSRKSGVGEETIAYLGRGHAFGLEEHWHNWKHLRSHPLLHNLRAIGYVDILRIPTPVLEDHVFPHLDPTQIDFPFETGPNRATSQERLEFLVDQRLINGTQAMVIDLDRCTRCDDCVRACAATHDGNPRFVRQGPVQEGQMFASACMHCVDPVCMIGCPTGAIGRMPDSGTVIIRDDICIGCSTCADSCPYDNIRMVEIRDEVGRIVKDEASGRPILKATKCDLCHDQPEGPACQRSCPHDALVRIDLRNVKRLEEWNSR